ncbi:phosphate permease [Coemansia reversa NRRL 1564]|uniref:Phosphate permease n=1 Tax=Coemansia reversa (strain ATCC 12441 / NRRL 1564) TaxID=763665 RepID=A0A2G5BD54_COERN|nr:phosphate permease [Coemansia reversa NRRL 1564]|eukprot:PIA16946.1 phosphate permease [Coemansia reversa NRRL 1564]
MTSTDNILNQNETLEIRRQALAEIDHAKFGWFHVKTCLVAGAGFFTDSYDIFAINLCSLIMGYVYYADAQGSAANTTPTKIDMWVKGSTQLGCIIGQFLFGYLSDRLGRKRMYGVELIIIIVCTIGGSFAGNTARGLSVYWVLFIWRLVLGIGIGGDYPVSAVITSEFATTKNRGAMVAAVFAMQGFGIVAAAIVAIIVLACFRSAIDSDQLMLDYVWRIIMGLGVVPGIVALYFRLTIPETPRYTLDVEKNTHRAAQDVQNTLGKLKQEDSSSRVLLQSNLQPEVAVSKPTWTEFYHHFKHWRHFKVLMGTAVTWFALDVAFYGINLNSSIILDAIGFAGNGSPYQKLLKNAGGNIILNLLGTLPGYWVTVFTIDRLGRRTIQFIGFTVLLILFCILGFAYHKILDKSVAGFVVLFTLAQFFQNFGPNATTFIIPAEAFPTRFRSTCHGISAACGKIGAVVSQLGFFQLKDRGGKNEFIPELIQIFALFMLVGLIFTWFVPETKGKSLEELNDEADR